MNTLTTKDLDEDSVKKCNVKGVKYLVWEIIILCLLRDVITVLCSPRLCCSTWD